MALLGFTLPPDSGEKLTLGENVNISFLPLDFVSTDSKEGFKPKFNAGSVYPNFQWKFTKKFPDSKIFWKVTKHAERICR